MPDEAQLAEARQSQDVKSTALLIPCVSNFLFGFRNLRPCAFTELSNG